MIGDELIPESGCCCFSSLGGGYNIPCISCKVVSYDQNVYVHTCMGIFYGQEVHVD